GPRNLLARCKIPDQLVTQASLGVKNLKVTVVFGGQTVFCGLPIAQEKSDFLYIHRQAGELDTGAAIGIIAVKQRSIPPQRGAVAFEDLQTGPSIVLAIFKSFFLFFES